MISDILYLVMMIVIITISIYKIIQKKLFDWDKKNRIITNFCNYSILVVLGVFVIIYTKDFSHKVISAVQMYRDNKALTLLWGFCDAKIKDENEKYVNVVQNGNVSLNYSKPYIPDGFKYVEGEWNTGYVVSDEYENEYVWVPCTNGDVDGVVKIEKMDFVKNPATSYYTCFDEKYDNFLESAVKYGGFYISRYEISYEDEKYCSKSGKKIITGITNKKASEIVEIFNSYNKDRDYDIKMINGYAYDIALKWILMDKSTAKNVSYNLTYGDSLLTGKSSNKGIYDFIDNILELTSEFCYDTQIVRGYPFSDVINESTGNDFSKESRYVVSIGDTYFSDYDLIAFRTLLIKR